MRIEVKRSTVFLRVAIDAPEGAAPQDVAAYARDALKSHCGGMDPEAPMFDLDRSKVRVSIARVDEQVTKIYGAEEGGE